MRISLSNASAALLLLASFGTLAAAERYCFDDTRFTEADWAFCQQIQPDLFMYYTPFPEEGNVMLGLHATRDTFGWTALALAGNGGMKGASQVVVRQENGEWIAEDRHSRDYVTPSLDASQDVKLLFANQTSCGETSWGVLIPMNSCDDDDYPIEDISVFMHWAFGDGHTFGFHGSRRGQFHANLMRAPKDVPSTDGLPYLDILMPDVPVVVGEGGSDPTNPYICSFFDISQLPKSNTNEELGPGSKVHVTRFSPVLDEDSKQFVHHMIFIIPECESMPSGCSIMKWPWAVGSEDIIFPEDVGLPFGGEQTMLVLQMHYYNPNLVEDIRDSSGVRVYFTTELRPEEAGVIALNGGTGPWQRPSVPAGQSDYALDPMVIPSSCTNYNWREPITVLGVIHHMHLAGLNMDINVERDGRSLGPLRHEKFYDFNHQSLEESPLGKLDPGDQLVMNCHYDTTGVTEDISFGDLTQQEMCYAIMMVYPVQDVDDYSYTPVAFNTEQCFTAGTGAFANVSACTENYMESVPTFFDFRNNVEDDFGAFDMCNSDWYESLLLPYLPASCPDCYKNSNCTAEEVAIHAQTVVCPNQCNMMGASVYPNVSQTEAYASGVWGCSENGPASPEFGWVQYTRAIEMQEANCTARGDLSQVVELADVPVGADESAADCGAVSGSTKLMLGGALVGTFVAVFTML
ncbi:DBH-like monooxygenase protein 1 [Seminavis robusta]|uniref:DBH-like monooxygenase protein 1 n=1 Tax=Seminavis robusta TaxID=568900 RepID=A0A9N8EJ97_9STRA|nr:DBH-like monooxygenase protein 1 [Seminavis robusta]|eukprot:Sro1293_g260110.1 DBH-like monooxygenase protein 1 (689) ;mRNA; f:11431-13775